MDEKALSAWLYGFIRNEAASPEAAMRVLIQVVVHLHDQFFNMYKPYIPPHLLDKDGKFNYDGFER